MDAFESIIALSLSEQGFWVKQGVKLDISKKHKRIIGTHSMPRPEIDIVAYKPAEKLLLLVEVKSYLDSTGVQYRDVIGEGKGSERYKLFTNKNFRKVVTQQIIKDYKQAGLISTEVKVNYALTAGKIKNGDEEKIQTYFNKNKWVLFTPKQVSKVLKDLANKGYDNNPVIVAAKLILR
jgi:hypothetical protein